jgi:hypothetical protein
VGAGQLASRAPSFTLLSAFTCTGLCLVLHTLAALASFLRDIGQWLVGTQLAVLSINQEGQDGIIADS